MSSTLPTPSPPRARRHLLSHFALLLAGVIALAFIVTFAGIFLLGGIEPWQQWQDAHAGHFLVWRLCLYAAVIAAWPWARRRRLQREPDAARPLRTIEVLGLAGVVLAEASNWLHLH